MHTRQLHIMLLVCVLFEIFPPPPRLLYINNKLRTSLQERGKRLKNALKVCCGFSLFRSDFRIFSTHRLRIEKSIYATDRGIHLRHPLTYTITYKLSIILLRHVCTLLYYGLLNEIAQNVFCKNDNSVRSFFDIIGTITIET